MKLGLNRNRISNISLRWVLIILFLIVILSEFYLAYSYLYVNIFGPAPEIPEGNIVRVNLKAYETTADYLEGLNTYEPPSLDLGKENPFQ